MGEISKLPKLFKDIYPIWFHLCCGFRRDFEMRTLEAMTGARTDKLLGAILGVFHPGHAFLERLPLHFFYKFLQPRRAHQQKSLVDIFEMAQIFYNCFKVVGFNALI
jgi:hypothetical protein